MVNEAIFKNPSSSFIEEFQTYYKISDVQIDPGSTKRQELLGHELTHVVQQREGRVKPDTEQHKGLNINSGIKYKLKETYNFKK